MINEKHLSMKKQHDVKEVWLLLKLVHNTIITALFNLLFVICNVKIIDKPRYVDYRILKTTGLFSLENLFAPRWINIILMYHRLFLSSLHKLLVCPNYIIFSDFLWQIFFI